MEQLPKWLDVVRIAEIAILVLAYLQYAKTKLSFPSNIISYLGLFLGVVISWVAMAYQGQVIPWAKIIFDGLTAAVFAEVGYQFLSNTGGRFILPSKAEEK